MIDLIKRARMVAEFSTDREIVTELADEIEHLRELMQQIIDAADDIRTSILNKIEDVADAALERTDG